MKNVSQLTGKTLSFYGINFSTFSASPNWCGYFEIKVDFSFELIDEAIFLFESFFAPKSKKIMIVTALSYDDSREENISVLQKYNSIYENNKEKNLLAPLTSCYEKYLFGDIPLPANALNFSFSLNDFIDISKLIMGHAGVLGQVCFYLNQEVGVAIYPHEDIGFGCISLSSDKIICQEFLRYCSSSHNFNVVINS